MQRLLQNLLEKKVIRYIINGVLTAAVEYSVFIFCFYIGDFHINLANSVSYIAAMIVNFLLLRLWVFKSTTPQLAAQISHYIALVTVNFVVSNILIYILVGLEFEGFMAKALTMIMIVIWNFVIMNKYIFTNKTNKNYKKQ